MSGLNACCRTRSSAEAYSFTDYDIERFILHWYSKCAPPKIGLVTLGFNEGIYTFRTTMISSENV